ncbi:hypothetical protein Skr01_15450 [Sphaerisporangium krabiense]|uniref:Uncharacterized protein n=1 Tax=Sphaerisporangium krabiense TaxID=763782 RepID=A0A7W8YZC8_9ACTN|nr:hypothetical protein [Sphaerisporangium krabiense]MBB5624586.1 hypothetical protein [Sphaerisporangium krabiense]GII61460.1 hypothetical protein Skr01_15450 [Sphaerisporangium krabiense]
MDPVLTALADHWDDVHERLAPERSRALDALAADLAAATTDRARRGVRQRLIDELRHSLPVDHPVREAIVRGSRATTGTPVEWHAAVDRLTETFVQRDARLARLDLLAEPGHTPDEVRGMGADPATPGLLRLPLPEGGHRLPAFQFTAEGRPHAVVLAVNELLGAATDPWGVADWWCRPNSRLDAVPAALLGVVPDGDLYTAARAVRGDE